jgi:hypothetical protein
MRVMSWDGPVHLIAVPLPTYLRVCRYAAESNKHWISVVKSIRIELQTLNSTVLTSFDIDKVQDLSGAFIRGCPAFPEA